MRVLEIIFWIGLFIVFYTYIGYGMLLYALVKLKECFRKTAAPPPPAAASASPPVPQAAAFIMYPFPAFCNRLPLFFR